MSEHRDAADAHIKGKLLLSLTKGPIQRDKDEGDYIHWLLAGKWGAQSLHDVFTAKPVKQQHAKVATNTTLNHAEASAAENRLGSHETVRWRPRKMWTTHKLAEDFKGGLKWKVTLEIRLSNRPVICRRKKSSRLRPSASPSSLSSEKPFPQQWHDLILLHPQSITQSKVYLVTTPCTNWSEFETRFLRV